MTYHRKSKGTHRTDNEFTVKGGVPLGGPLSTGGPGKWMKVPETVQQPKEQQPPTDEKPVRMHHRMAIPYKAS